MTEKGKPRFVFYLGERIRRWSAPPIFPGDDEKTLRAGRLNVALLNIFLLIPLLVVGDLLGGKTPAPVFGVDALAFLFTLLLRRWMHQGRGRLASITLLSTSVVLIAAGVAALGTIRSPAAAMFLLVVITGGVLFDARGILIMTTVCGAVLAGLAGAETAGWLPRPDFSITVTQWVAYAAIFGWAGSLTYASLRQLHAVLDRMKGEAAERERGEIALRESEERLRLANLATNDVIWEWDIVNDSQRWNKEGAVVFGWSDIVERPQSAAWWVGRVHPEDRQRVDAHFFAVVADPKADFWRDEYRFRKADGSYAQIANRGYVLRDAEGRAVRMIGAMLDITERKRAESALRESEERIRSILENSLDAILLTAPDGGIFAANPAACRMFGRSEDEIRRLRRFGIIDQSDPRVARAVEERSRAGRFQGELTGLRKDGTKFPIEVSTSIFVDRNGQMRTSMVIRDITERRRAEEELKTSHAELQSISARLEQSREEEKANIAREIHDELGQRLTGLIMDLSMLARKMPTSLGPLKEKAEAFEDEAKDLVKAVRKIATSLRPGILDDMGLVAAIEWQAGEFASRTGIPCVCDCPGFAGEIDPNRAIGVFRILQEALTNVVRYSQARSVRIEFREEAGQVVLKVADDGRGITPAEASGTATLGLAGMRERARLLGGEVRISGSPGKSTSVELRFPRDAGDHKERT